MPFKLSKSEKTQRSALHSALQDAEAALSDAVETFNTGLGELKEPLTQALDLYNEAVSNAREFAEDIGGQAESDLSEKSERWLEGERGQAADAFREAWSEGDFEPVELELPDDLEEPELGHADRFNDLPEE